MHALARHTAPVSPPPTAALFAYGHNSLAARIEGASPHALVQMLYDRLLRLLRDARLAAVAGDVAGRLAATARAIAIVEGLDATLDDRRGGDVATSLHGIYRLLSDRLLAGKADGLAEAEEAVSAIASAWRTIR